MFVLRRFLVAKLLIATILFAIQTTGFIHGEEVIRDVYVVNQPQSQRQRELFALLATLASQTGMELRFVENSEAPSLLTIKFTREGMYVGVSEVDTSTSIGASILDLDAGVFVPGNYLDESYRHDSSADLISGILHYALGDCNEAILHFENAQNELDSQSYKAEGAFFSLETLVGNCALLQGKYDLAIENLAHTVGLEGSADLYGSNLSTITNVTWAYIQIKDRDPFSLFNDYIHWIEIYKRDYPDYYDDYVYVDALIQRAQLYALAEHYDDAIADLTAAIELPTDDTPDLFILRGKMYLAQYEWDSALADYNHAIELDPTDADAYYERGVLYYSILQTGVELRADAYDDFHRYIELAPNGDHAADALRYAAQIEKELEALNG